MLHFEHILAFCSLLHSHGPKVLSCQINSACRRGTSEFAENNIFRACFAFYYARSHAHAYKRGVHSGKRAPQKLFYHYRTNKRGATR